MVNPIRDNLHFWYEATFGNLEHNRIISGVVQRTDYFKTIFSDVSNVRIPLEYRSQ